MQYSRDYDLLNEMSTSELAKLTGDPAGVTIDEDRIYWARFNADTIIDAYLYGRYKVPFGEPYDELLVYMSKELTIVNLYEYSYSKSLLPSSIYSRKLNVLGLLKNLQKGLIKLMVPPGFDKNVSPIISNKSDSRRIFDEKMLEDFRNL